MQRELVLGRIDGNRRDSEFRRRAENANSDFRPVRDQQSLDLARRNPLHRAIIYGCMWLATLLLQRSKSVALLFGNSRYGRAPPWYRGNYASRSTGRMGRQWERIG